MVRFHMPDQSVFGFVFSFNCHVNQDIEAGKIGVAVDDGARLLRVQQGQFMNCIQKSIDEFPLFLAKGDLGCPGPRRFDYVAHCHSTEQVARQCPSGAPFLECDSEYARAVGGCAGAIQLWKRLIQTANGAARRATFREYLRKCVTELVQQFAIQVSQRFAAFHVHRAYGLARYYDRVQAVARTSEQARDLVGLLARGID
jgi:hypothetical protein